MTYTGNITESGKFPEIPGKGSTFDERLRFCMAEKQETATNLHKKLSEGFQIKRGYETVLGWLKKRENVNEQYPAIYLNDAIALAKIFNVQPLWLLTGEGPHRELRDFIRESGYEQPEELKIQRKEDLIKHLSCIQYGYIPVFISNFNPFIYTDSVILCPNTELAPFINARFSRTLTKGSGYHNLLVNALNTSITGLFPNWMLSRFSPNGVDYLRMYYVRDSSMAPELNEGDLAVVNTYFPSFRKINLISNHVYAFVSIFGYVFFRRVQLNYNGTAVKLLSANSQTAEDVPMSEIDTLPNSSTLLQDAKFFSYLGLPPIVREKIKSTKNNELAKAYNYLSKNEEYQNYEKVFKEHNDLLEIPKYKKLFLIGHVVYRKEALPSAIDPAYSSFAAIFNNFETIDRYRDVGDEGV